ncbi:MAG: hypothetical protein ACC628_10515 [Pirellulaceae bacterium]
MPERISRKPWLMLGLGLTLGLLVGVGMLIGSLVATHAGPAQWELPETLLHATGSCGGDTMAIATGPIDEGMEGLFILDYLTGQLQCYVLNPNTGVVGATFVRNVVGDLGAEGKQTKYLLVTGQAVFRNISGNVRLADSVVYVMDANSGRFAAYSIPWNRTAFTSNVSQSSAMYLLGSGDARQIALER